MLVKVGVIVGMDEEIAGTDVVSIGAVEDTWRVDVGWRIGSVRMGATLVVVVGRTIGSALCVSSTESREPVESTDSPSSESESSSSRAEERQMTWHDSADRDDGMSEHQRRSSPITANPGVNAFPW